VEARLFDLCHLALRTSQECVAIIYYRTPTINSRIELVDELLSTILPKKEKTSGSHDHPAVKEWKEIKKRIIGHLPVRNSIAHHPLDTHYETLDGKCWSETGRGFSKSDYEKLRPKSDAVLITLPILKKHLQELEILDKILFNFRFTANRAQDELLTRPSHMPPQD
jgi:hypothetical protein